MLIYDGDCGFCQRSVGWAQRLGATCEFVSSYDADLDALGLDVDDTHAAAWYVGSSGRLWRGHEAIGMALASSRWWPVRVAGRVIGSRVLRPVASRGYQWVADNRDRMPGGGGTCAVR